MVATGASITACSGGGGGGGGGPTGTPVGDLRGSYTVTHSLSLAGLTIGECTGALVIASMNGNAFAGTISITDQDRCAGLIGQGTIQGMLGEGDAVTFTVTLPGLEELLAQVGCVILSGGDTFTGTASSTRVRGTRRNQVGCDGNQAEGQWQIVAEKE